MATAMRALHYPKAGALKLGCHATGAAFRCKAVYRHHRIRRFYAEWKYSPSGGWICAGRKLATCKILRHGFITKASARTLGLTTSAQQAAIGYMAINYDDPQPYVAPNCVQSTRPSTWSFCYALDTSDLNVTVHMGRVKNGYITTVTAATY